MCGKLFRLVAIGTIHSDNLVPVIDTTGYASRPISQIHQTTEELSGGGENQHGLTLPVGDYDVVVGVDTDGLWDDGKTRFVGK